MPVCDLSIKCDERMKKEDNLYEDILAIVETQERADMIFDLIDDYFCWYNDWCGCCSYNEVQDELERYKKEAKEIRKEEEIPF